MSADDTSLGNQKINNLIIRKPNRKQSCPINVAHSKKYEPKLDSLVSRKTTQESGISSSDQEILSSSSHDWLKPGLSLPKFRGKNDIIKEVRESIKKQENGSGEGRLSDVMLTEEVIEEKIKADEERSDLPSEDFLPRIEIIRPNVKILEKSRRSIDGFSECPSNIHVYSSGLESSGVKEDEESSVKKLEEETRALKNWKLWMKRRKKQHEVLCRKTEREPPELIMNRDKKSFKKVMDEKNLPQPPYIPDPDKAQISPSFWNSGDKSIHRNLPEEHIKTETYEDERISSEMEFPEISKGSSIPSIHIHEETDVPCHSIISDKVFQCCYPRIDVDRESTVCLAINNIELKCVYYARTSELFMADTEISEWTLIFETAPVGTVQTKTLNIENRGTMAVRYHWTFKIPYSNPVKYPKARRDNHSPWFYFDKNPGIFLPGQKYDFDFYHFSKTPGLHVETWVLETVPLLFNPPTEIKIVLAAISDHDYSLNDLLSIDDYINKCVAETVAKQILEEMLDRAFVCPVIEVDYESFFLEEDLFRHQNPRHHYHSEMVEELKEIYSEIPLDYPQEWDFNLLNLRGLIELKMEGEMKRSKICRVNELARALLKPSYVSHKSEGKYYLVYTLLSKVANTIEEGAMHLKASLSDIPLDISTKKTNEELRENEEVQKLEEENKVCEIRGINLDQIKSANYYQCLYIQIYHQLCLAVEQVVSVIESSKIFDHHGEIGLNLLKEEQEDVSENYLLYCPSNRSSASSVAHGESSQSTQKKKSLKSTQKEKSSKSTMKEKSSKSVMKGQSSSTNPMSQT